MLPWFDSPSEQQINRQRASITLPCSLLNFMLLASLTACFLAFHPSWQIVASQKQRAECELLGAGGCFAFISRLYAYRRREAAFYGAGSPALPVPLSLSSCVARERGKGKRGGEGTWSES